MTQTRRKTPRKPPRKPPRRTQPLRREVKALELPARYRSAALQNVADRNERLRGLKAAALLVARFSRINSRFSRIANIPVRIILAPRFDRMFANQNIQFVHFSRLRHKARLRELCEL